MAVRTLEYSVGIGGIIPAVELFAGTQGDIKATKLIFSLDDTLSLIKDKENIYYRFDGYDAEGNVLRGEYALLREDLSSNKLSFTLPEQLTLNGGRICVYLIITQIVDGGTEMELYSFPARMRLNSLPQGGEVSDEEYDSLTTLAVSARDSANAAALSAESANNARIKTAKINEDSELVLTYEDESSVNLGCVKGEKGDTGPEGPQGIQGPEGEKGDKGEAGDTGLQGEKGDKGDQGEQGEQGIQGEKGDSGVYVGTEEPTDENVTVWVNPDGITDEPLTVEVTETDNGHNVTITDANGTNTFEVLNGKDGEKGETGATGEVGPQGPQGEIGEAGQDGYTPQKGVDYWTDEDKADVVKDVLDSVVVQYPEAHVIYGDVDSENNIVIYGDLASGTYSLKYEYANGTQTDIGELIIGTHSQVLTYPVGMVWTNGKSIDQSTGVEDEGEAIGYAISDSINIETGFTYVLKQSPGGYGYVRVLYYNETVYLGYEELWSRELSGNARLAKKLTPVSGATSFRLKYGNTSGVDAYLCNQLSMIRTTGSVEEEITYQYGWKTTAEENKYLSYTTDTSTNICTSSNMIVDKNTYIYTLSNYRWGASSDICAGAVNIYYYDSNANLLNIENVWTEAESATAIAPKELNIPDNTSYIVIQLQYPAGTEAHIGLIGVYRTTINPFA